MTPQRYFTWAFILSIGGTIFSGYLSAHKLFVKSCAFGETCPMVFGWPACYYGFAVFLLLFGASAMGLRFPRSNVRGPAIKIMAWGSLFGLIFAGALTAQEIGNWLDAGSVSYRLGLPTCSYGALFYAILLALTVKALSDRTKPAEPPRRETAA